MTEAEKIKKRNEAKERVKLWWNKPEHKPTKEREEKGRHGDIMDPALQEKDE